MATTPLIRHYYHVYADGHWREPVTEHFAAFTAVVTPMAVTVGVVGARERRDEVWAVLDGLLAYRRVEADTGWEHVTLNALRADLASGHHDPVLYGHTKGAHDPSPINVAWRRSMTRQVIGRWRECLDHLGRVDAVGCHWLTPRHWPDLVDSPFFGGNFWWARPSYLRRLPPLPDTRRWDAERWIGLGNPRVHDLLPGWPSLRLCGAA